MQRAVYHHSTQHADYLAMRNAFIMGSIIAFVGWLIAYHI